MFFKINFNLLINQVQFQFLKIYDGQSPNFKTINSNEIKNIITNFYESYIAENLNNWLLHYNKHIKDKKISFLSDKNIRKEELSCIKVC